MAQERDNVAGTLNQNGGSGGPGNLSRQQFFIGINDPLGQNPTGAPFNPKAFTEFDAWANLVGSTAAVRRASINRWAHVGVFKGPILHTLSSRPPYFHNGSARTLADVVKFYDTRFHIGFTAQESADLQAFLEALCECRLLRQDTFVQRRGRRALPRIQE